MSNYQAVYAQLNRSMRSFAGLVSIERRRVGALDSRALPVAQLVLQLVELAMQRGDLGLEPPHALQQVGRSGAGHDRWRRLVVVEGDADLETRSPLHLGPIGLVLVGDMELDNLRDRDRVGDLELGALAGNVAHQAIEAGTPIVEIQSPLQEASLTQECAAFIGGGRHGRFRIAG